MGYGYKKNIDMKNEAFVIPLLCPDILEYIKGREEVCKIVLAICQVQAINLPAVITLHTNLFTTPGFTNTDVVYIIQKTSEELLVHFSYSLLIKVDKNYTVEDLANLLWKYMCRVVKCN